MVLERGSAGSKDRVALPYNEVESRMCVTSMVGDHYRDKWFPQWPQTPAVTEPGSIPWALLQQFNGVPREEFDKLKAEVEEMKKLLARAKEYDERNGEPACEIDEKMDLLRKVAKLVGVDLDDVIQPKAAK